MNGRRWTQLRAGHSGCQNVTLLLLFRDYVFECHFSSHLDSIAIQWKFQCHETCLNWEENNGSPSTSSFIFPFSTAWGLEIAQLLSPCPGCTSSIREGSIKLMRFGDLSENKVSPHSAYWVRAVLSKVVLLICVIRCLRVVAVIPFLYPSLIFCLWG